MKKNLNIEGITNELEGASLFFKKSQTPPPQVKLPAEEKTTLTESPAPVEIIVESAPLPEIKTEKRVQAKRRDTVIPRHHGITTPRYHDTVIPQVPNEIVGLVRKAVKEFGKEAATHRFTEIEKREIADIIYTYKNRGLKTSENEITRISVNFIIEDYKQNGENSVLHKILKALNE